MQIGAEDHQLADPGNLGILTSVIPIPTKPTKRVRELSNHLYKWCEVGIDLLWIRDATLVPHAHIAIATAILFLSQMAILRSHHCI